MLSSIKRDWSSSTAGASASSSVKGAASGSTSSSNLAGPNGSPNAKKGKGRAASDVIELDLDDEPTRRVEPPVKKSRLFDKSSSFTDPKEPAPAPLSPRSRRRLAVLSYQKLQGSAESAPSVSSGSLLTKERDSSDTWVDLMGASAPRKKVAAVVPKAENSMSANLKPLVTVDPPKMKKGKIVLSDEQKKVLDMVVDKGLNIFFTGSAGTGKSVLLREIITQLKLKWKIRPEAVAVTAATGIAACHVGGTTLHSWAGIGIGIEPVEKLIQRIRKNQQALQRWTRTKALIIDEVSMVDGELFDKLGKIGQVLRRNPAPFGGLQVVICGDFFQLPPVAKNDNVKFAFEAQLWKETISRTVNLTQVFRQKDQKMVDMLNEMRFGQLSVASVREFKKLDREVVYSDGLAPTELWPLRQDVSQSNSRRLIQLRGDPHHFKAEDSVGQSWRGTPDQLQKELNNMLAEPRLELKEEAQVMLLKNYDDDLVNGSVGKVLGFRTQKQHKAMIEGGEYGEGVRFSSEDTDSGSQKGKNMPNDRDETSYPVVEFHTSSGTRIIRLVRRDVFKIDGPDGEMKCQREQLPLILAWAMSIHKAQGQTLERVKCDLRRIFEKGQAYVALSRATSLESLQVLNFDAAKVMCHPKVARFSHSLETIK